MTTHIIDISGWICGIRQYTDHIINHKPPFIFVERFTDAFTSKKSDFGFHDDLSSVFKIGMIIPSPMKADRNQKTWRGRCRFGPIPLRLPAPQLSGRLESEQVGFSRPELPCFS